MYKSSAAPENISLGDEISVPSDIFPVFNMLMSSISDAPLNSFTAFGPSGPG